MIEDIKKHPPRGKGKKTLMLEAIRAELDSDVGEKEFLQEVVRIGLGRRPNDDGDVSDPNPALLTLVLNRIEPPLKSSCQLIEFELDSNDDPHIQAEKVILGVSKGEIAPDSGKMIIDSIATMLKIQEVTDIDERLKKMELHLEQD